MTDNNELRIRIMSRKEYSHADGYTLRCPVCQQAIKEGEGFDVHEALLTRGDVQGSQFSKAIFTKYNCVGRHHICPGGKQYHQPGHDEWSVYCNIVQHLCWHEGRDNIEHWLEQMSDLFKSTLVEEAIAKFDKAIKELGG